MFNRIKLLWAVPLLAAGLGLPAQEGPSPQAPLKASSEYAAYRSGFLKDYDQLRPVHGTRGLLFFADKSFDFKSYTKFAFDPVQVITVPQKGGQKITPEVEDRLKSEALAAFKKALEPDYQVVDAAGPGVLRVRFAITGVKPVKPDLNPSNFIPIGIIVHAGQAAMGKSRKYAELSGEMEVLSPADKRAAAASFKRRGTEKLGKGYAITWEQMDAIIGQWAVNFRARVDALRGVAKP